MRGRIFWLLVLAGSGLYLLNPGFGVLEIIPDNLPLLGNVDETAAVLLLLRSLIELNIVGAATVKRMLNVKDGLNRVVLGDRLERK
jgi:hypothetical protein